MCAVELNEEVESAELALPDGHPVLSLIELLRRTDL